MSPEPDPARELPPFSPIKKPTLGLEKPTLGRLEKASVKRRKASEEGRQAWRDNLAKAHEANRRQKELSGGVTKDMRLTPEQAHDMIRQELLTTDMVLEHAKAVRRQVKRGSQASRYRAALDWRDQFLGKPTLVRTDEEISPPTIIIESSIFGRIAAAAAEEEGESEE